MLRPRIIPCLLLRANGLVKTVGFADSKYVGDPINAVRIFNEKGADELIILDIDASTRCAEPNFRLIESFAAEARMPLCYGGGIQSVDHAKTIISLGVEKVAISSAAIADQSFISRVAAAVGSQSVVAVLDVKAGRWGTYEVWTQNGTKNTKLSPKELAIKLVQAGVGEIVLNSIDNDGRMKGYDLKMVELVREAIDVPLTVLGGAGSLNDISELILRFGVIGAAAGSLFVFKGIYRAVLINYPSTNERDQIFDEYFASGSES
jgi:cyclase